jgi:hypothetical protein
MNLPNNDKLNFLVSIEVKYGQALTGGIVAMHKLAYNLANRGHNVFTFCEPEYKHENIKVIPSRLVKVNETETKMEWDLFHYPMNKTVSIYPQIVVGNPHNTSNVTRWILYHTEPQIEQTYGDEDVYFNFGSFKTVKNVPHKKLTVFNYYFDRLFITNQGSRKGFCHLSHKNTPPDGNKMFDNFNSFDLGRWKTSGAFDYLREQFNKFEYFLTYDQKSFFTVAATLCGCKAIILKSDTHTEERTNAFTLSEDYGKTLTPTEYRLSNPIQMFGVAYGFDDISWANKTIGFARDYIQELEKIDQKSVDDFISYWEKKLLSNG